MYGDQTFHEQVFDVMVFSYTGDGEAFKHQIVKDVHLKKAEITRGYKIESGSLLENQG